MKFRLTFYGAAGEVTGSRYLLEAGGARILLDCGLFQGHRRESIEKNHTFPFDPGGLDCVLLSHAHIDHSGALPLLAKSGFSKTIHCAAPTDELCRIMLMDSAHLQEEDAKFFNKIHQREGIQIEPLYNQEDVEKALECFRPHDYGNFFEIGPGIRARFLNAGHVLGSAMVQIEVDTPKGKRRIHFTGDLGRRESILMQPPAIPDNVDFLITESTYGGRSHEPISQVGEIFSRVIQRTVQEKGRILIPSFALERTQEIVYVLEKLRREKKIPPIHMYVDSPMAVDLTAIFNKYLAKGGDPSGMGTVRYVRSVEESKKLNDLPGEKIILSASGMCEGGRILHHLRNNIDKDNTTILLVGYQAEGTLGRRLHEGAKKVKIFGLMHDVRARVEMMPQFSSHADKDDLAWFIGGLSPRPRKIFLVHGDPQQKEALISSLTQAGIGHIENPRLGESFDLT